MIKFEIDSEQLHSKHLIYRDLGYGTNPGVPVSDYSFRITNSELLNTLNNSFEAFISQCKADDMSFSDSDIPELKNLDYPSLENMLTSNRELLGRLLKDFMYFDILDALFGTNLRPDWRFAINDITDISDEQEGYLLRGKGYFLE